MTETDNALVLSRTYDAPRAALWRCWTEPELLAVLGVWVLAQIVRGRRRVRLAKALLIPFSRPPYGITRTWPAGDPAGWQRPGRRPR